MFTLIIYFVVTIVSGGEISTTMLCLATMIDIANCMLIVFVDGMIRSSIADAKIKVVQELNKGKINSNLTEKR